MPELVLFCDRRHERFVDFDTSRFVVGKASGLDIGDRHLEMGDLIPQGALSATTLRQLYEPPMAQIELAEYAATRSYLREACARRKVDLDALLKPPVPKIVLPDLDGLSRKDLTALCDENGLDTDGSKADLRARLEALVE